MIDYAAAYEDTRIRIVQLARTLVEEQLQRRIPATPDWNAKDLIGHMVGTAIDISNSNVEGVGSAEWTDDQVRRGRALSLEDLLSEWDELAPEISQSLNLFPRTMAGMFVGDVAIHEHDLRNGVGKPGARDSVGVEVGLDTYAFRFRRKVEKEGLAPIVVSDGAREWRGDGEPAATVTGEPFELFRALTGRRTPAEIQQNLDWSGDFEKYLPLVSFYGIPESSLKE
jgi:uncharacterized protein (TIGR03083 family)